MANSSRHLASKICVSYRFYRAACDADAV